MPVVMLEAEQVRLKPQSLGRLKLSITRGEVVEKFEGVEPRLAFPMSHGTDVVSFRNDEGKEIGLLKHTDMLDEVSEKALFGALGMTYFIPEITEIYSIEEEYGVTRWKVKTDRGPREFNVQSRHDVRPVSKHRFLIRDIDGNRYEIRDSTGLDPQSLSILEYEI